MKYSTDFGPIHAGPGPQGSGSCYDAYRNIEMFHVGGGLVVKLQAPALASYREACKVLGHPIALTGSWRSCRYQAQLFASDSTRYADPRVTLHTRGLAIDVSQARPMTELQRIHRLLVGRGWHRVRDDEPWHYSFHFTA